MGSGDDVKGVDKEALYARKRTGKKEGKKRKKDALVR